MKKLGQGKGEKGKEKEKKQEEEKDHAKQLAIVKAQFESLLLEIPNPDGYDKVATFLTAGDLCDQDHGVLGRPPCQGKGQPWGQGGPKGS